jgi:hypothetical protein
VLEGGVLCPLDVRFENIDVEGDVGMEPIEPPSDSMRFGATLRIAETCTWRDVLALLGGPCGHTRSMRTSVGIGLPLPTVIAARTVAWAGGSATGPPSTVSSSGPRTDRDTPIGERHHDL